MGNILYLLEETLGADFALVKAHKADPLGNAVFRYTAMNSNREMATAADYCIVECEELV